jgi:hypothetical protein
MFAILETHLGITYGMMKRRKINFQGTYPFSRILITSLWISVSNISFDLGGGKEKKKNEIR